MKYATSLKLLSALAVVTVLAAPAFADQNTPAVGSGHGAKAMGAASQTLTPFPKKWWADD